MAKKGNDTTLAPSAGEGWDAWGAACGFTSWAQAAHAIGITVAHLVTVRKHAPRKTIRLAMDAILAAQAAQGDAARRRLAEIADVPSDTLDRLLIGRATEGDQLLAHNAIRAAETRAVPDDKARLDLLQNEVIDTIYMDDGRIIDVRGLDVRKAIDEFAAAPQPGESEVSHA